MSDPFNNDPQPRPVGIVGPGTQPTGDDGVALEYLAMPGAMQTYQPPPLPDRDEIADCAEGLRLLVALQRLLSSYRIGALPQVLDLSRLRRNDHRLVTDTLGEGEVSIQSGARTAQETRLAGVWRVREPSPVQGHGAHRGAHHGAHGRDVLEVCAVPGFVHFATFGDAASTIDAEDPAAPGLMNAPGVIAELNAALAARQNDSVNEPRAINLDLLPLTAPDLAHVERRLGRGSTEILSRGYGNCRITATAIRDLWWVRYFNSDDRPIMNTLEVTDVPVAALAAQEDVVDSAERLAEILQALAPGSLDRDGEIGRSSCEESEARIDG